MYRIKDSTNSIIYEGRNGNEVFKVLTAEPEDITEADEIMYGELMRTLSWHGELRLLEYADNGNLIVTLMFRGVDDWNRPVYKDVERKMYYGSVTQLFNWDDTEEYINSQIKIDELEYFGESFNCEPHGGRNEGINFKIIS